MSDGSDFEKYRAKVIDMVNNQRRQGGNGGAKWGQGGGGAGGGDGFEFQAPPKWVWFLPIVIVVLLTVMKGFYTVETEEEAVVTRFGAYLKTTEPGLHFKIPWVDEIYKVQSKKRQEEVFGFRKLDGNRRRVYAEESLMLTGDLNLADVQWTVQFEISDPAKFLFRARDVKKTVRDVSMSAVRQIVGDRRVSNVLTVGRAEIGLKVKELMQATLAGYDLGLNITAVALQTVTPPESVRPAYNDVNAAKQEMEQAINKAEREYNRVIPEARGKGEKEIANAQAYAIRVVNRARGDASRFTEVLAEYNKAPKVTRTRIYLETMEEIFSNIEEFTVVDGDAKGLLPVSGKVLNK